MLGTQFLKSKKAGRSQNCLGEDLNAGTNMAAKPTSMCSPYSAAYAVNRFSIRDFVASRWTINE